MMSKYEKKMKENYLEKKNLFHSLFTIPLCSALAGLAPVLWPLFKDCVDRSQSSRCSGLVLKLTK